MIANLDDITAAFKSRGEIFEQSFKQHLESREEYLQLLDRSVSHLLARLIVCWLCYYT